MSYLIIIHQALHYKRFKYFVLWLDWYFLNMNFI